MNERLILWFNVIRERVGGKFTRALSVMVLLFIGFKLFSFAVFSDPLDDVAFQKAFNEHYRIFSLNLPANASFAGEKVPLEVLDVRERLDRELLVNTYWQSNTILFHKRANRYFPIIEPILKKYKIPEDFKYLAIIESGLDNVVSPMGATGFWQLMKPSAGEYGLEVNDKVDERFNIKKSTEAACRYLRDAHQAFGSWTMAAASYNLGKNGLLKQLSRQKVNNYYDLLLNAETARYIYRIIAVKEILNNSAKYGYTIRKTDLYPPIPTSTIVVDSSISDLADFSKSRGINYKILKLMNPWLRDNTLPNKNNKTYHLEIPTGEVADLRPIDQSEFVPPVVDQTLPVISDTTAAE